MWDHILQHDKFELYNTMAFPLSMLHQKGSARLLDTGSPTNLIGDNTSNLMELDAIENCRGVREWIDRESPMGVRCVGHGHQETWQDGVNHIGLGHECDATFKSTLMPDSELPGFWGGHGLKEHRALTDCTNGCVYIVGHGGYEITLNPGSNKYALEPSKGGHWMLPCAEYPTQHTRINETGNANVFVQGDYFNAHPTNNIYNTEVENMTNDTVEECAEPSVAILFRISTRQMEEGHDAYDAACAAAAAT